MTDFAGGRRVIDMHNDDLMTIIRESVDKIDTQRNKYCYGISALTAMINTYAQRCPRWFPTPLRQRTISISTTPTT